MNRLAVSAMCAVLVLALASGAFGMMGLAVGAHGGYASYSAAGVSNGGVDFGVDANVSLPMLFSFQLFIDYFAYTDTPEGPGPVIETSFTDIPIGLHMMYGISLPGSPIKPYLGLGPSVHLMKTEFTGLSAPEDQSTTKFGVGGVGGVEYKFMPKLALFLELRDHIVFTEEENTNALYVLGGVRLHLP